VATSYGDRLDNRDQKYLLPVYVALPVLVGAGLASLPVSAGVPLLVGVLLVQGAGAAAGTLGALDRGNVARRAAQRQAYWNGVKELDRMGLHALYTTNPEASLFTFLSRERVAVSARYQESYPPYARAVDGAPRAGWWFGGRDRGFEAHLAALGVRFDFHPLEPRGGAYVDFVLPAERLHELDPRAFRATASANGDDAGRAVDRDAATSWSSRGTRRGGEWLAVDLGRVEPVTLVRWLPRVFQEVPSGLRLELSVDGIAWQRAIELPVYEGPLYWSAGRPMQRVRSGRVELRVPPTPARYLRVTQLGQEGFWGWSVRELFVYAADAAGAWSVPDADGQALARAVRAAGITRLYADHGWGSRVALTDPEVRVLPANLAVDAYNFPGPGMADLPPVRWQPGSGALVEGPDAASFARTAEASGLGIVRTDLGAFRLFTYAPPPALPGRPVPVADLRVTASVDPARAPRAADGRRHTRWTTGRAQAAGDWLRVDFRAPVRIRAVRVQTESPAESPRELRLEGTTDGATWSALAPTAHTASPTRWGGFTWLRDGVDTIRLDVAPITLRGIRLTLVRGAPVAAWSVHELVVYSDD
jgi:hypothetical protein